MSDTAIKASHVSLKYLLTSERPRTLQEFLINLAHGRRHAKKEFWALKDVSFEVARGESLGILGPNGAGKSTLLKIISGILEPTEGEIEVHGRIAPLIELGAGFDQELTGGENIYLNASLLGLRKREIDRKFKGIVEFSELEDFIYSPLKSYSSGMVARLAFSIAAEVEAEILVVDEVLSVGDEGFRKKCHQRIDAFIRGGVSLFFVTHSIGEIQRLCHHAMWLDRGKTHAYGNVHTVSRRYLLHFEQKAFEDIPVGHPSKRYIDAMYLHGIITGFFVNGKRYYSPDNKVSRAELAVFLGCALGVNKTGASREVFEDVPEAHWAFRYIRWACEEGLIDPITDQDGRFHFYPEDYITAKELKNALSRIDRAKSDKIRWDEPQTVNREDLAKAFYEFFDYAEGEHPTEAY
jgi:ABC-2 type transport system ATP-binding protein/lipopolysaccharide transport system ATP-binding protein